MEELFKKYITERHVKESTSNLYKQTLALLYRKIIGNQNTTVRMTKTRDLFKTLNPNMEWVMDVDVVDNAIKDYSLNNKKLIYNILAPLLTTLGTKKGIEFGNIYRKKLFDIATIVNNQTKKQTITKTKLKENWVSFDVILERYNDYCTRVGNGGLAIDGSDRMNTAFIATSLMLLFCPRRPSALEHLKVITEYPFPPVESLNSDFNYLLITSQNNGKSLWVLNNYKTNTIYGRQVFEISTRLNRLLILYMKNRKKPLNFEKEKQPFLLQKTVGNSLTNQGFTSTGISQIIKKFITEELKIPNISCTDLRTIYITTWYHKKPRYVLEVESESYRMGNSISEFTKTYIKREDEIS